MLWIAAGTIAGVSALGALAGYVRRPKPAEAVTPTGLLDRIVALSYAASAAELAAAIDRAVNFATVLGLVKTAAAIKAMPIPSPFKQPIVQPALPIDETWPGTNQSVFSYVTEKRKGVA